MNNPFDNFDISIRAINGLKYAGFMSMDDVVAFLDNHNVADLKIRLGRCSSRTHKEVIECLIENGFLEREPEPKEPALEYPQ